MKDLDVERQIRGILRDRLRVDPPDPATDLLESGLLDSLGFVDLVASIESTFDIVVSLVDVDLDEFRTVGSIARFVRARVQPGAALEAPMGGPAPQPAPTLTAEAG